MDADHEKWMRHALALAERGRGYVEPNPLVGAVLVKQGRIVGEGWHAKFGEAHAEVNAFAQAGDLANGAILYVTLEPCCHHGKTPPCTDAVLRAGVTHVYAALEDPFPRVAGQGGKRLRDAGVAVEFGLCAAEARRQNAPYLTLLSQGRPHVLGKWAMSLDGKIATRTGDSRWISNEESRRLVHQIRGHMDGILVGIGTALADNPALTARPVGPRTPNRIVLDGHARLPLTSQLVTTARETPVIVAVSELADEDRIAKLRDAGCEVISLPENLQGRLDVESLLHEFGKRHWTNLLIEGGSEVLASFAEAKLLDEVHVFIAPKLIGGRGALSPSGGLGVENVAEGMTWPHLATENLAGDLHLHAWR